MEIGSAFQRLSKLIGTDLICLAEEYGITVFKDSSQNKGWAGHVLEEYLGIPINSSKDTDFYNWELKKIAVWYNNKGEVKVKFPMAITMINPSEVAKCDFESSGLFSKLKKVMIVATIWEHEYQKSSVVYGVGTFEIYSNNKVYNQIKSDYNLIRDMIIDGNYYKVNGYMGKYVQARTKGEGRRAFYARATFLSDFILPNLVGTISE